MPIASINPATGGALATFSPHPEAEVERRLALAAQAFPLWRAVPFAERAGLMTAAAGLLESHKQDWARLMTREMGKPIDAGEAEAEKCAWVCRYYAEHARAIPAPTSRSPRTPAASFVRYEPLGPVLAVMPWNFPFWQVFRFAAPALMAGNVGLLKHASNVPAVRPGDRGASSAAPASPRACFQTLLVGSDRGRGAHRRPRASRPSR